MSAAVPQAADLFSQQEMGELKARIGRIKDYLSVPIFFLLHYAGEDASPRACNISCRSIGLISTGVNVNTATVCPSAVTNSTSHA
jgi:hypothetical protein